MLDTYHTSKKVLFKTDVIVMYCYFSLLFSFKIFIQRFFFFSDIQIHEVVKVLFIDFIFQHYFNYTFNLGVLHIYLALCFHWKSIRVVSTAKAFSVCLRFNTDAEKTLSAYSMTCMHVWDGIIFFFIAPRTKEANTMPWLEASEMLLCHQTCTLLRKELFSLRFLAPYHCYFSRGLFSYLSSSLTEAPRYSA